MISNVIRVSVMVVGLMIGAATMSSEVINGSACLENKRLKELTVNGSVSLESVVVDTTLTVAGSVSAEDCSFKDVFISGSCSLEDVNVTGDLIVHGSSSAEDCTVSTVTIHGSSNWEDCDISGEMIISGSANFESCNIDRSICFSGVEISLTNSFVGDSIAVKKISWLRSLFQSQKLKIFGTKILGDITFEAPGGIVEIDHASKIVGKVINGTIVCK